MKRIKNFFKKLLSEKGVKCSLIVLGGATLLAPIIAGLAFGFIGTCGAITACLSIDAIYCSSAYVALTIQERKANEQKQKVEIPYEAYLKDDENLEEKTKETKIYHIPYKSIGLESQNSKNTSYKNNDVEEKTL